MLKGEDVEALTSLSLSPNQAKIYLAIINIGEAEISQISKVSKVARQDIYRNLAQLNDLGLVEKVLDRPLKFRTIPLQYGVQILLDRIHKHNYESQRKALELIQRYIGKEKTEEGNGERAQFVLIPGKEMLIHNVKMASENAQSSIDCICPRQAFPKALLIMTESYKKAIRIGVKIR